MPKIKTVKGVKDRVKITGTGKLVAHHVGRRHLMGGKSAKKRRGLRRPIVLGSKGEVRQLKAIAPYLS